MLGKIEQKKCFQIAFCRGWLDEPDQRHWNQNKGLLSDGTNSISILASSSALAEVNGRNVNRCEGRIWPQVSPNIRINLQNIKFNETKLLLCLDFRNTINKLWIFGFSPFNSSPPSTLMFCSFRIEGHILSPLCTMLAQRCQQVVGLLQLRFLLTLSEEGLLHHFPTYTHCLQYRKS